jgi:RNA polymerase sigma-70 factor (ECF subfamily)
LRHWGSINGARQVAGREIVFFIKGIVTTVLSNSLLRVTNVISQVQFAQAAANSFTPRKILVSDQSNIRDSRVDEEAWFRFPEKRLAYRCFMDICFIQEKEVVESTDEGLVYETLIQRFEQPVFNIVSRLIDNQSDAADVVENVFREIFRNAGAFRGEGSLKNWIYRIAVSKARNHGRWFRRRWPRRVGLGRKPETQALIEETLSTMNPKLRAALVLREVEGLSCEEISEILGVTPDTVRSRTARGRDALTRHLAGRLNPSAAMAWSGELAE